MNRYAKTTVRSQNAVSFNNGGSSWAPPLRLAEKEFNGLFARIENRILHHCDRPEGEVRILKFIGGAHGPSTEGIARELGMSTAAAEVHLRELMRANRIWGQPTSGQGVAWHIAQAGRHFLAERGPSQA